MDLPIIEEFDRLRPIEDKPFRSACYAPFSSLDFDANGFVRSCGVTRDYVLGDLRDETLAEIWSGFRATQLRDALRCYDMASGCEFCETRIVQGGDFPSHFPGHLFHQKHFDSIPVTGDSEFLPTHLTFRLGNKAVRNGGGRTESNISPASSSPYGNAFFEELRRFVPFVESVQFFGGEPFRVDEHYRVWELLVELGHVRECQVLTEGGTYNKRVEWVLHELPCTITLSVEGISKETIERTRPGADLDMFMENFCRFQEYSLAAGRFLYFDFILSRVNWHELPEVLRFAERHCCLANIRFNHSLPMYRIDTMNVDELQHVVDTLARRDSQMLAKLQRNRNAWHVALDSLKRRLEYLRKEKETARESSTTARQQI